MFRARSLQAALVGAAAGSPSSTQNALTGHHPFVTPPVYPLGDLWSARNFESTLVRTDEGSAIKTHMPQPTPQKMSQTASVAAATAPVKSEKTFQPWKDDVGCPTPTKPSKLKKTPFNIEALSKPDDSSATIIGAGECSSSKDDEAKDFKFSLHPKKRRLASPDIPEEACQTICGIASGIGSMKPKKRAVQVLQKREQPVAGSSSTANSALQQTSPLQSSIAAGPVLAEQPDSESLLHRAARSGNLEIVNFCLEQCGEVDLKQRGLTQATALHEAASKGLLADARALLERGADPEAETPQGVRPLHEAAAKGHIEVVRLLLSFGAQVDAKTFSGDTAMSIASMFDFKFLRTFLENFLEDNTFVDEEAAEKEEIPNRKPWTFNGTCSYLDQKSESGFNVLAGAPECSLLPEIAIRTFRVLRPISEDGAMQSLTCAHLDELIASTGLTDVGVFLRTIGDEISQQIVFSVDRTMETDAFSRYYGHLAMVRAIRWDEESKRLLSQALSRGQDQQQMTSSNANNST